MTLNESASEILADHTTFHIGGRADRVIVVHDELEFIEAVNQADDAATPVLVMSGGSNMLISDDGFRGTVILVATSGVRVTESACAGAYLTVAAGESWDGLAERAVDSGWVGLEMLSGIPGLAGAAPIQNIGAYGAEIASSIARVRTFDRLTRTVTTFWPFNCLFGYRTSVFKQNPGRYLILDIDLQLELGTLSAPIEYAELARHVGADIGARAPLADVREAVLDLRRGKGMVLDENDHDTWSAGSFFTNPIIDADQASRLPQDAPRFSQDDGHIKTSAAWLIDHAGFHKGYGDGPATLSTKHVLALTNRGQATAQDVIALAREIQEGVRTMYGITLEPEPILVGLTL